MKTLHQFGVRVVVCALAGVLVLGGGFAVAGDDAATEENLRTRLEERRRERIAALQRGEAPRRVASLDALLGMEGVKATVSEIEGGGATLVIISDDEEMAARILETAREVVGRMAAVGERLAVERQRRVREAPVDDARREALGERREQMRARREELESMDDNEREALREQWRERRQRRLEDADPEVRERMLERMRGAEERTRQRRDRTGD